LKTYPKLRLFFILSVLSCCFLGGCRKDPETIENHDYLLKSGDILISIPDFSVELEMKRAAYPYNIQNNPGEYNQLVMRLISQLSEEILLKRAAAEKGIRVTEQQVAQAETVLRADYPGNTFETMLLENAVTYSFWKKKFQTRLLIDRFIELEISKKIEVTAEEMSQYYDQYKKKNMSGNDAVENAINETDLVKLFKMKKTEENYSGWIETLKNKYSVKINHNQLKRLLKN